jgi:hypothetical protein
MLAKDVVTSGLDAIVFPNLGSISGRAPLHTAKAPCWDHDAMIDFPRRALSFHRDLSNTCVLPGTSRRCKNLSTPFSSSSAALDPSLDALLNDTACPPNHARPRRGFIVLHRVHREPVPGYKREPDVLRSYLRLTPLLSPSQDPSRHAGASPCCCSPAGAPWPGLPRGWRASLSSPRTSPSLPIYPILLAVFLSV